MKGKTIDNINKTIHSNTNPTLIEALFNLHNLF